MEPVTLIPSSPPSNLPSVENAILDDLFKAIQSKPKESIEQMNRILKHNSNLCNEASYWTDEDDDKTLQAFLKKEKLEHLSTPDILRYLQAKEKYLGGEDMQVQTSSQLPLHIACLFGNYEAVEILLEQPDIDLNAMNGDEETPLAVSCRAGQASIAKLLLEASAKDTVQPNAKIAVNHPDRFGNTPMKHLTCRGSDPLWLEGPSDDFLECLARMMFKALDADSDSARPSWMRQAAKLGSLWLLRVLLDEAPETRNIDVADGWTPLCFAIIQGDSEAVEWLLRAGASTKVRGGIANRQDQQDAQNFAKEHGEFEIAKIIDSFRSCQFPDAPSTKSFGWISSTDIGKHGRTVEYKSTSIESLIERCKQSGEHPRITWCHLPVNNWHWMKAILQSAPITAPDQFLLDHLEENFELSKDLSLGRDFFVGQTAKSSSGSAMDSANTLDQILRNGRSLMAMLPVIDIDILDGYKGIQAGNRSLVKEVMALYSNREYKGLRPARTLDHYYQDDLSTEALKGLNESQVFTRYLENTQTSGENQGNDGAKPKRILVVSNFWLVRTNDSLITSFPERRGQKTGSEGLLLPEVMQRMFNNTRNPQVSFHDMVKKALQYQTWITSRGQRTTYLDVFSKEVLRISRQTDACYSEFKKSLGRSDKYFKRLSQDATACLLDIDDVRSEIQIIQRVFADQERVWRQMHTQHSFDASNDDADSKDSEARILLPKACIWGIQNCTPNVVSSSSRDSLREIETAAKAVHNKILELVSLLHGQAGTENALRASEQARYLAIFTWLTVVFVESFTPAQWARWDVVIACVVSVTATILLCALPFSWMKYGDRLSNKLHEAAMKDRSSRQPETQCQDTRVDAEPRLIQISNKDRPEHLIALHDIDVESGDLRVVHNRSA